MLSSTGMRSQSQCLHCLRASNNNYAKRLSIASTIRPIATSSRNLSDDRSDKTSINQIEANDKKTIIITEEMERKTKKVVMTTLSIVEENERIRQLLLDRDGGSASVPTREGKWDQEMGRETSKQMHRVLDQVRVSKPGTSTSLGESESKHRFK